MHGADTRAPPASLWQLGVPVLGICYGQQVMMEALGGRVEGGHHREFGRAWVTPAGNHGADTIFAGLFDAGARGGLDEPRRPCRGARPRLRGDHCTSPNAPFAIAADQARGFYAVQFHPEVHHTPNGRACWPISPGWPGSPATGRWPPTAIRPSPRSARTVGDGRVICGLSGGVDSSVAAVLIHEAVGEQLTCVFVDTA